MKPPANWIDKYCNQNGRTILTYNELGIPGMNMFGRHILSKAISALNLHYHQDAIEITYIAKGNASFHVDDKEYRLSGGDIFITHANEIHSTGRVPISLSEMYWMQLDISRIDSFLFLGEQWARDLISSLTGLKNRVIKVNNVFSHKIITMFFSTMCREETAGKYKGASLVLLFLYMIIERDQLISFSLTPDIAKSTDYILENIAENIHLEELAKLSILSVSRFKVKFKNQLGVTPREFINYYKIERSKELLQKGCSVTETAMELNFSSSNYFSVVFKRFSSFSPTQYIKNGIDDTIDL